MIFNLLKSFLMPDYKTLNTEYAIMNSPIKEKSAYLLKIYIYLDLSFIKLLIMMRNRSIYCIKVLELHLT